jgi:YHS domain-containing protein
MLSTLFRILGLFFLAWLFQRVLGFILGAFKGNRVKSDPAGSSNQMVKDPVCGMYMDSRLAVRLDRKSEEFYFCSEECKQKYLNDPSGSGVSGSPGPH